MTKEITQKKRKTYSLDPEMSRELAQHSLNMSEDLEKNVPRQTILDVLVLCLKDKAVFTKVKNIIKKL